MLNESCQCSNTNQCIFNRNAGLQSLEALLTIAPSTVAPSRAFYITDHTASAQSQLISDSEAAARSVDKLLNDPSAGSNGFLC